MQSGATFLVSSPERALPYWYALAVLTFLIGIPAGIWLSLGGFLVIPAAKIECLRTGALFARSGALTSGIRFKLCAVILAILALRGTLALLAGWLLAHLAVARPDASNLVTFFLFPFLIFILDALCGPLWGTATACVYADRADAELLRKSPASLFARVNESWTKINPPSKRASCTATPFHDVVNGGRSVSLITAAKPLKEETLRSGFSPQAAL